MLNKNIYLLYPPGYSGTYISWCISKSETSTSSSTVDSPINLKNNDKYGGYGTAHLHHRTPTHCNIQQIEYWLILNKPQDKRIFLVNAHNEGEMAIAINHILNFDRDPVIIHISTQDRYAMALANLNAITKWPLYFKATNLDEKYNIDLTCKDKKLTRNNFVKHYDNFFPMSRPIDFDTTFTYEPNYKMFRKSYTDWYNLRHSHNPHEVNSSEFVEPYYKPKRYFALDFLEIFNETFVETLSSILEECDIGEFEYSYVSEYHHNYVENQPHLRFIEEIYKFRHSKVLTDYLTSHPLLEALVIKELINELPINYNWEEETLQQIVNVYNRHKGL